MTATPTRHELELGLDVGTDVYGEGELGDRLGLQVAMLLAAQREAGLQEVQSLRGQLEANASEFWQGYSSGLNDACLVVRRVAHGDG